MEFVHKIESAVVLGNILHDPSTPGLIGRDRAGKMIDTTDSRLQLEALVKIPAMRIYAGPSEALRIGDAGDRIPTISKERGLELALAAEPSLSRSRVISGILPNGSSEKYLRDDLQQLGELFPLRRPLGRERELLLSFVLPSEPTREEAPRVATYCLILHLCQAAGRAVSQEDILELAVSPSIDTVPTQLRQCCDGWARFVVRDMLVAVHEAAVALVARNIQVNGGESGRRPREDVLAELTSDGLDQGLKAFGLVSLTGESPISAFCQAVQSQLGGCARAGNINRWNGVLTELSVIEESEVSSAALVTLPLAWLLAVRRMEPGILERVPGFDLDGMRAASRMGVRDVLMPVVDRWLHERTTIREVVAGLLSRAVDQHIRIALSRLSNEPWKDVSVIASDGDEWVFCQDFNNGRATSRLYQAISWLSQLGLLDDDGVTPEGADVLQSRLASLARIQEGPA